MLVVILFFFNNKSFLGAHSYLGSGGYVKKSFIGRYCSIGHRVTIGAGVHQTETLSTHPSLGGIFMPLTIVHNDVWIGDGVVIMPGVVVGNGAIIGANSVVTKDVLPYSIVAGAPAKHLRYRFESEVICKLTSSNWWDLEHNFLIGLRKMSLGQQLECILGEYDKNIYHHETFTYSR